MKRINWLSSFRQTSPRAKSLRPKETALEALECRIAPSDLLSLMDGGSLLTSAFFMSSPTSDLYFDADAAPPSEENGGSDENERTLPSQERNVRTRNIWTPGQETKAVPFSPQQPSASDAVGADTSESDTLFGPGLLDELLLSAPAVPLTAVRMPPLPPVERVPLPDLSPEGGGGGGGGGETGGAGGGGGQVGAGGGQSGQAGGTSASMPAGGESSAALPASSSAVTAEALSAPACGDFTGNHSGSGSFSPGGNFSASGTGQVSGGVQGAYTIQFAGQGSLTAGVFYGTVSGAINGSFSGTYTSDGSGGIATDTTYTLEEGSATGTGSFTLNLSTLTFTFSGTIEHVNAAPVADAGGPYVINGGDSLTLDGSGSYDPDGNPITYSWDVNGDGTEDASGATPTIDWATLHSLGVRQGQQYTATLTVTDCGGADDSDSATVTVTKPLVWLSSSPDAVLREHGITPDNGKLSAHRTGATDDALTVSFSVSGTAENGVDYTGVTGSVVIPAGASSADIIINAGNDTIVEGDETVILTLLPSDEYETNEDAVTATAVIHDNDSWQWMAHTGTGLNGYSQTKMLPDYDWFPGEDPAEMGMVVDASATDSSVTASLFAFLDDPDLVSDDWYEVSSDLLLSFEFEPTSGTITRNDYQNLGVAQQGPLGAAIGVKYTIDNSGDSQHTVTVDLSFLAAVTGTVTYSVDAQGGTGDKTTGGASIGVANQTPSGGKIPADTGFTLKLQVVEDNS